MPTKPPEVWRTEVFTQQEFGLVAEAQVAAELVVDRGVELDDVLLGVVVGQAVVDVARHVDREAVERRHAIVNVVLAVLQDGAAA